MFRSNELRQGKDQLHFVLSTMAASHLSTAREVTNESAVAPKAATGTLELSLYHVLSGLLLTIICMGILWWGFVRHWLFTL